MSTFKIDFFEFCFLVEACIPPRPIARSMFWDHVIDFYYHQMEQSERTNLYEWITKKYGFDPEENYQCKIFERRFNPDNQYRVTTKKDEKEEVHETFKVDNTYHIYINTFIIPENIIHIEKIENGQI